MENHITYSEKVSYDSKAIRRMRNIFTLSLMVMDERRENSNKPANYVDPDWQYREIQDALDQLSVGIDHGLELSQKYNKNLLDTYDIVTRIYYERIMNMYYYYRDTDKMIKSCNGCTLSVGANLVLTMGGPRKKAA